MLYEEIARNTMFEICWSIWQPLYKFYRKSREFDYRIKIFIGLKYLRPFVMHKQISNSFAKNLVTSETDIIIMQVFGMPELEYVAYKN